MPSWRCENSRWESFDLTTGEWSGADDGGTSDSNGIGFSRGRGSNSESGDNAAIWFDIKVKDYDPNTNEGDDDGLSHRAERFHGSDPEVKDSDGDGLDDRWEVIYGLDPDDGTTDLTVDNDNDGIELEDEYKYGGIPDQKDIFVEMDWMENNLKLGGEILTWVVTPFARKDIALHIDDSSEPSSKVKYMGGGKEISRVEFLGFYDSDIKTDFCPNYILKTPCVVDVSNSVQSMFNDNNYFSSDRKNIFHYLVIGYYPGYNRDNHGPPNGKSPHGRADSGDDYLALWWETIRWDHSAYSKWLASYFMHELGHTLGLNADSLYYNTDWDPIPDDVYPSAMRYGRKSSDDGFIDFSDKGGYADNIVTWKKPLGEGRSLDQNDWLHLDLENFAT